MNSDVGYGISLSHDPAIKVRFNDAKHFLLSDRFEISFPTTHWVNYAIQSSTDLRDWQAVGSGISRHHEVIRKSIAREEKALFFRVILYE